jgi:hypothetical protein
MRGSVVGVSSRLVDPKSLARTEGDLEAVRRARKPEVSDTVEFLLRVLVVEVVGGRSGSPSLGWYNGASFFA